MIGERTWRLVWAGIVAVCAVLLAVAMRSVLIGVLFAAVTYGSVLLIEVVWHPFRDRPKGKR